MRRRRPPLKVPRAGGAQRGAGKDERGTGASGVSARPGAGSGRAPPTGAGLEGEGRWEGEGLPRPGGQGELVFGSERSGAGSPGGGTVRSRRLPEFFHPPEKVWEPAGQSSEGARGRRGRLGTDIPPACSPRLAPLLLLLLQPRRCEKLAALVCERGSGREEMPKNRLDTITYSLLWNDPARAERLDRMTQCGPFQPCFSGSQEGRSGLYPGRQAVPVPGMPRGMRGESRAGEELLVLPHRRAQLLGVFLGLIPEGSRSKSAVPCFPCWGSGGAVPPERTARPTALPEPSLVLPTGSCLCRGDRLVCPALCIPDSRDGLGVWQPELRKEMDLQVEKERAAALPVAFPDLASFCSRASRYFSG